MKWRRLRNWLLSLRVPGKWEDLAWERDVALAPSSTRRLIYGKIAVGCVLFWLYFATFSIEERWAVDAALEHWRMTHE